MKYSNQITLAITTYRRPQKLDRLLSSIKKLSTFPKKILIIDNDIEKSALAIAVKWKKCLPIRYVNEKRRGTPHARNRALNEVRTQFLCFVDDDCIIDHNWLNTLQKKISVTFTRNNKYAYILGQSKLLNEKNHLARLQYARYRRWFYDNLNENNLSHLLLDTKNICFDIKKLRKHNLQFDTRYGLYETAGSEDTDLGLQISKHGLRGSFCHNMIVFHEEITKFSLSLKKTFQKGKLEASLHEKWRFCNIFQRIVSEEKTNTLFFMKLTTIFFKEIIFNKISLFDQVLTTLFLLGYWKRKNQIKKIFIVYCADGLANSLRANKIKEFLEKNNFNVVLFDTNKFLKKFYKNKSKETFWTWIDYHLRFFRKLYRIWPPYNISIKYPFYFKLLERANEISKLQQFKDADIIIGQSPFEMFSLLKAKSKQKTILDSPTSFSDELLYSDKRIPYRELELIKKAEQKVYSEVNVVTFHWFGFKNFIEQKHKIKITNYVPTGWGAEIISNTPPSFGELSKTKIVYMGNLDDYWINQKLLLNLIKSSKYEIHLYGKTNNKSIKNLIQYKGFLKKSDLYKLSQYQFGLITLSKDPLRSSGFSAKHLFYYSHGLPVLCPEWRQDKWLKKGTIFYNLDNFNEQIEKFSKKSMWNEKQKHSIKIAQKYSWENCFSNLQTGLIK